MLYYRLYLLDGAGHILWCRDFDANTDTLAVETAEGLSEGGPAELWQEGRMVHAFAAEQGSRKG